MIGLLALILGLRGRKIDDHRWCRLCRYDLFGCEQVLLCPECGQSLERKRAVRRGRRERRPWVIATASVLLAAALAVSGTMVWGKASAFDWNTVKPVWWLRREADRFAIGPGEAARRELVSRLEGGQISPGQIAWIVEDAHPDDPFAEGDLWADALRRKGGEYSLLARMPPDPSVN